MTPGTQVSLKALIRSMTHICDKELMALSVRVPIQCTNRLTVCYCCLRALGAPAALLALADCLLSR